MDEEDEEAGRLNISVRPSVRSYVRWSSKLRRRRKKRFRSSEEGGRKRLISEDKYSAFEDAEKFLTGKESKTIGAIQSKDSPRKSKESADAALRIHLQRCAPHVGLKEYLYYFLRRTQLDVTRKKR